jgi:hypothetical protein
MIDNSHGVVETLKAAPAVAYGSAVIWGIPVSDWVTYITGVYIVLQVILLIPKYVQWYHSWRTKCQSKPDSSSSD